jgi:NADP-dependent 3-hydroxy acid dehydrogenase YdfG
MPELRAQAAPGERPARRLAVVAGASAGIGAAIARTLGAGGYPVALGARRVQRCEEVADEIRAGGGEAYAHELDIGDSASVDAFAKAVAERLGDVEVVVANAGTMPNGAVVEIPPDDFAAALNVNAVGVLRLIHAFLPPMLARRRGDLVVISSEVIQQPRPLVGAYVASKWAAEGLTRTLQMELEGTGVRASIVRPGPTASEIATGWDMDAAMQVVKYGRKFGSLRHYGYLSPAAVAQTVAHVVAAPRGVHLATTYVAPEAPITEVPE